jgi:uncharacterized membrane protein
MAKDVADVVGTALGRVAREAAQSVASDGRKRSGPLPAMRKGPGPLSGMKGVAAGAGLAALAPLATKGAGKLAKRALTNGADPVKKASEKVGEGVKDAVGKSADQAGGAAGLAKEAGKGLMPGGGDKSGGAPGVGKGRRMPIQQSVDVAVPLKTAYNQWTQFEEWPSFMHRLDRVSQEDETNVTFKAKIWGISKEFKAEIQDQRPDDRIKWHVTEGLSHSGVVSFHELAPRLTRIELTLDIEPGSLIEKAARGMRHVKRAVRADLKRFKAYVEMEEEETGSWRGVIEDGEKKSSRRQKKSSSGNRKRSSSGSRSQGSSSGNRSRSSSGGTKASSSGARSRSSSNRRGSSSSRRSSSGKSGSGSGRKKSSARS